MTIVIILSIIMIIFFNDSFQASIVLIKHRKVYFHRARHAGSDGSMSASGSADPGFEPRWGSKFSFENFQPRG